MATNLQQARTKKETFPSRAEAEAWAKEEKAKFKQGGMSARWFVNSTKDKTQWQATVQITLEET
jgi:hypothetical protein